jgi:hypothetical protein
MVELRIRSPDLPHAIQYSSSGRGSTVSACAKGPRLSGVLVSR